MGNGNANEAVFGILPGKIPIGNPGYRWEDNIKIDYS
jgi:hypothetical protein